MGTIASQITSLAIVYWIVYSSAYQRKHQSSASLAFVRGIHRGPVNSPHKWPVTRKMFPFDDVIMVCQPNPVAVRPPGCRRTSVWLSVCLSLTLPASLHALAWPTLNNSSVCFSALLLVALSLSVFLSVYLTLSLSPFLVHRDAGRKQQYLTLNWYIKADTKRPLFSRRHFQMHFLEWKCMNFE